MKDTSYVTIQSWMRTKLDLKGNDLMVYAVIYGFSQDGESRFTGSLQYLADWCGATKQGVQKNLKNLVDLGLIEKTEVYKNGQKFCEYSCTLCNSVACPIQRSCINKQANKQEEDIVLSKDNTTTEKSDYESHSYSKEDFIGSAKKTKGQNLYSKCIHEIDMFTDLPDLRAVLVQYLTFRLAIKDKPLYNLNQWKAMLKKLDGAVEECLCEYKDVVQQSIDKGWLNFYPIQKCNNSRNIHTVSSELGEVNSDKREENYADEEF